MKISSAAYEKAGKRTKALQGQREMAYFMNCTITAFFISWGNKYPNPLFTYKPLLKQFREKGLLLREYERKVGEHFLSCVPQNSLPTQFRVPFLKRLYQTNIFTIKTLYLSNLKISQLNKASQQRFNKQLVTALGLVFSAIGRSIIVLFFVLWKAP